MKVKRWLNRESRSRGEGTVAEKSVTEWYGGEYHRTSRLEHIKVG